LGYKTSDVDREHAEESDVEDKVVHDDIDIEERIIGLVTFFTVCRGTGYNSSSMG
jgi:hypothetical protein